MFLAMAHWRLGHHEDALQKYHTALRWMQDNAVVDEELARFLQETAVVLQQPIPVLPKAPPAVPPERRRAIPVIAVRVPCGAPATGRKSPRQRVMQVRPTFGIVWQ